MAASISAAVVRLGEVTAAECSTAVVRLGVVTAAESSTASVTESFSSWGDASSRFTLTGSDLSFTVSALSFGSSNPFEATAGTSGDACTATARTATTSESTLAVMGPLQSVQYQIVLANRVLDSL